MHQETRRSLRKPSLWAQLYLPKQCGPRKAFAVRAIAPIENFYTERISWGAKNHALGLETRFFTCLAERPLRIGFAGRCEKRRLSNRRLALTRISHQLTGQAHEGPAIASLRLLAVLKVLSEYASLIKWGDQVGVVKRRAPRTDRHLMYFASPPDEQCGLIPFTESLRSQSH